MVVVESVTVGSKAKWSLSQLLVILLIMKLLTKMLTMLMLLLLLLMAMTINVKF